MLTSSTSDRLTSLMASRTLGSWLHAVTLLGAFAVIMRLQATQWFFFDEWYFIVEPGPGPLTPHVGHWSTAPEWIFDRLVSSFGINSYLPYAALVTVIHLICVHLVWRLTLKAGVTPVIASLGAALLAVLGAGSENILWAFQIGFLGALALGLGAAVLVTTARPTYLRMGLALGLSMFSLMWSGTALAMVATTTIILWRKRNWKHALGFATVVGAVYLSWYITFALHKPGNPDTGGVAPHKMFVAMPQFIGVMISEGFGRIFPVRAVGAIVAVAIAIWLATRLRRWALPSGFTPAGALAAGGAVFVVMTAYTRATLSVESGQSSRYVYVVALLGMPLILIALERAATRSHLPTIIAPLILVALTCTQGLQLKDDARFQAAREAQSHREVNAAAYLARLDDVDVDPAAHPDPNWAPYLTMAALTRLVDEGRLTPTAPTDDDLQIAKDRVSIASPR